MPLDRRGFCKIAGLSLIGLAGGTKMAMRSGEDGALQVIPAGSGETIAEPIVGRRWAMVVDTAACKREEGCRDCIAACHRVHNVPKIDNPEEEVKWIWKQRMEEALPSRENEFLEGDREPEDVLVFCNHCDNPPCTRVCPTQATWKREDGIVMMDWHRCIGCRYCMAACPYGSRSFNWRNPRPYIQDPTPEFPTRTRGVVEKCTFCDERLARGLMPACVDACEHGCLKFGDLEDPDSEVRRILETRTALRRKTELGTRPQVYYLV